MHMAAYRELGLPHSYEALRVSSDALEGTIDELRRGIFAGYNITAPHKTRALSFVDRVDESARMPGCTNTLVRNPDGKVVAFNTDVAAIGAELREFGAEWSNARVLVLGTGGAARATLVACVRELGARRFVVRGRNTAGPT